MAGIKVGAKKWGANGLLAIVTRCEEMIRISKTCYPGNTKNPNDYRSRFVDLVPITDSANDRKLFSFLEGESRLESHT